MGQVYSSFPKNFEFGEISESAFNTRLNKTIYHFSHEVEVVFGNKGENLTCRNIVNGKVVGTATVQFDLH